MTEDNYQRAVLMGDPEAFRVQGGANPHTRTRWGTRRKVDRALAIQQWQNLRALLEDLGIFVFVVPADSKQPGLVYPANAGFCSDVDAEIPLAQKKFYLSNLLPSRAMEKPHYYKIIESAGIRTEAIDPGLRFEGEADFFPAGDIYVLTSGPLEEQRFVPHLGIPPWKRIYGFRTDAAVLPILTPIVAPKTVLPLELCLEEHYHGDTAICAFGPGREHLLVYEDALLHESLERLQASFGKQILALSNHDAQHYAANSFGFNRGDESFLVLPDGVSPRLLDRIRERGVTPITVNVSEFLKKGGGSVKCMIGDLGPIPGSLLPDRP